MGKTQPLKNPDDITAMKQYFLEKGLIRSYAMVTVGINTSLRIGDLLSLRWRDVYSAESCCYCAHLVLREQKTGKETRIALNKEAIGALERLRSSCNCPQPDDYIFKSRVGENRPIGRSTAWRIIRRAAGDLHLEGVIGCHSLRKTFGYHAWRQGIPPALIMAIYNHSSMEITKRYLSIDQDDKDAVFLHMNL